MTVFFGAKPPLSCADCQLGQYTLYGPTRIAAPQEIYVRRRKILTFNAQKTFLREGDVLTQIFTLYSGWAFSFKQLNDGRRQILAFLLPGDSIILESLCFPYETMPYSVRSLTDLSVCAFPLFDMLSLIGSTEAQTQNASKAMWKHADTANRRLLDLGRRSAIARVSQLIVEIEARLQQRDLVKDGCFHFPVRQEHIADALGLTTVYVNRTLDRLRKDGIIEFQRNRMKIVDRASLHMISEEG